MRQTKMPLSSRLFGELTWDTEMPDYPTLNGMWRLSDGRAVEVALVGKAEMSRTWIDSLQRAEASAEALLSNESRLLVSALPRIAEEHQSYYPGRLTGSPETLLLELSLRLLCFYTDDCAHLWYQGSATFNFLDVDIGVDAELRVTEVRFDG
jgi:hypothetical protein